jgi:hypothetical protein
MTKDIKDYLHLYLGCEVACYSDHLRPEMEFERNATLDGIVNDSSRNEHPVKVSFHNEGFKYRSHYCYKFNEVKPLLRPLSDMTEEEVIKYLRLKHNAYSGEYEIKLRDNGFWWLFKTIASDEKFKFFGEMLDESNSDQFRWLLSKGFDLFGLIEAGLAIDKTKLPTPV